MTKITLLTLCIALLNELQAQDTIYYLETPRLSWEHFLGKPSDDESGAQISSTIQLRFDKVNPWTGKVKKVTATALMIPAQSWVRDDHKNDYALNHEQLHFDIAQLWALRLSQDLNNRKTMTSSRANIMKAFKDHEGRLDEMQNEYDEKTAGGRNPVVQSQWNEKIRAQIAELMSNGGL